MSFVKLATAALAFTGLAFSSGVVPQSRDDLEQVARRALLDAHAPGFIYVRSVTSDSLAAHASVPDPNRLDTGADSSVVPLSIIKVFVAAEWLQLGLGAFVVDCAASAGHPARRMLVEDVIVSSCDSAGAQMATMLRRRFGAERVLKDLRRFGADASGLAPQASDPEWGAALSLGEKGITVTPRAVAAFLAAIGRGGGGLLRPDTARALARALDAVVQRGTASGIRGALAGSGWRIGGKTGTGPGACGSQCDGWFAGLVSDGRGARYVVVVFIRGKGAGGGVAVRAAAQVAAALAR